MRSGLIAINLSAILFGSAALYGKLDVSPAWIVAVRAFFAVIALIIFGLLRDKRIQFPKKSLLIPLSISGILLAIHWVTFFISVKLSGISIATLTFATFPFFTVLFSSFAHKRFPKLLEIVAGIIIIVAVGLLVDINISGDKLFGTVVGLISAIVFALFGLKSKKLTLEISPLSVSLAQNIVVALCLLPFLPVTTPVPDSTYEWLCLVLFGVIGTALMHQLYLYALTKLSAKTCSGFVALEPVYAILFSAMFFNEQITFNLIICGVLIIGASLVFLLSDDPH